MGVGVKYNDELTYRVLGYADDTTFVEDRIEQMIERLTNVTNESKDRSDMQIRMDKTLSHHIQEDDDKIEVTKEEITQVQDKFEHKCDFCECKFKTLVEMRIHRDK